MSGIPTSPLRTKNLDLQRDALTTTGCQRIFEEKSGKAGTKRPEFGAVLARGRKGGRPKELREDDAVIGRALLAAGTIGVAEIARRLGVNRDTFYSCLLRANSTAAKG